MGLWTVELEKQDNDKNNYLYYNSLQKYSKKMWGSKMIAEIAENLYKACMFKYPLYLFIHVKLYCLARDYFIKNKLVGKYNFFFILFIKFFISKFYAALKFS